MVVCWCSVLFFKPKTSYEMRISDWSSDVCSSDLTPVMIGEGPVAAGQLSDVPAEAGNTAEAAPDEIIVTARSEAPPSDPLQNVNIEAFQVDRKRVVSGTSVSVRVDLGGRRIITKESNTKNLCQYHSSVVAT